MTVRGRASHILPHDLGTADLVLSDEEVDFGLFEVGSMKSAKFTLMNTGDMVRIRSNVSMSAVPRAT